MLDSIKAHLDTRWTAPDLTVLIWETWGEDFILFDSRNSQTHLLNGLAAVALQNLQIQSLSVDALTTSLNEAAESEIVSNQTIRQLISEFDHLGLVEPVVHDA